MKITGDILESYLRCKYKAHLKLTKQQGIKADYELLLLESRNRVRMAAIDKLVTRHKKSDVAQGVVTTLKILKRDAPLLLDASVEDEELSVCFDALQKEAGPSLLRQFSLYPGFVP